MVHFFNAYTLIQPVITAPWVLWGSQESLP